MNMFVDNAFDRLKKTDSISDQYQIIGNLLEHGLKPSAIARRAGLKDYTVRHHARLHNKLTDAVKDLFVAKRISFSLARAIASLPDEQQEPAARKALGLHISVQTFRRTGQQNDDSTFQREMNRLSEKLSEISGLAITIRPDKKNTRAGNLIVRYTDLSMFDVITEKIIGKSRLEDF